jgi:hypothetical protein
MRLQRRHRYLVRPGLQTPVALLAGGVALAGLCAGIALLALVPLILQAFSHRRLLAAPTVMEAFATSWPWLIVGGLGLAGAGAFLGIRTTHRVAGPLNRLEGLLAAWPNRQPAPRVQLRLGDECQALARHLDRILSA